MSGAKTLEKSEDQKRIDTVSEKKVRTRRAPTAGNSAPMEKKAMSKDTQKGETEKKKRVVHFKGGVFGVFTRKQEKKINLRGRYYFQKVLEDLPIFSRR